MQATTGSDATRQGSSVFGGPLSRSTALTLGFSGQRSDRFLDPVHPDNLHNSGNAANATAEFNWLVSPSSTLVGRRRRRPLELRRAAQRRSGRGRSGSAAEESADVADRHRGSAHGRPTPCRRSPAIIGRARRRSSAASTTRRCSLNADRSLRRVGVLGSVTHHRGKHVLKAGVEAARLSLHEDFSFFVTDEDEGEEAESERGRARARRGRSVRVQRPARTRRCSRFYVQDSIQFGRGLTVDFGVRADRARMLIDASQWSPRLGAAYHVPDSGTTIRGSVDRFFQPPQAENLLLGSSEEARELRRSSTKQAAAKTSSRSGSGRPSSASTRRLRARRAVRRVVLAPPRRKRGRSRTCSSARRIIVPNAIARGEADGVDVRLELPRRRGVSGYVSYTNARVVQFRPGDRRAVPRRRSHRDCRWHGVHARSRSAPCRRVRRELRSPRGGFWASFGGRYESGTPLEVDEDELDELMERPGSELVNFETGRVRPRQMFDVLAGTRLFRAGGHEISLRGSILNLTGERFAYNFGNPFSGTHFGPGRTFQIGVQVRLGRTQTLTLDLSPQP